MSWLLDYLVRRPDVNPNLKNDINFSPLATALHENNMEGAKIIGMRPDLVVDEIDNEIAKSNGINLKDIVKPVSFEEMGASTVKQTSDGEASYHEVLSKIFANR
jgi:hypothetical protein